jgi:hypothetical protein
VARFSALVCPGCGAPLPSDALLRVVTCAFCAASVAAEEGLVSAAAFRRARAELDDEARERADLSVAGVPYRVLARVAAGEHSDVFLAERAHRITERVIVKVLREGGDGAALDREWSALEALHASTAQGAPLMSRRLPQLVGRGAASDSRRPALVFRAASGFVHTLEDVRRAYPSGVDARHAIWMWRRILELLGWVHRSGFVHGAINPAHAILHARDHGVMLVGWSSAVRSFDTRTDLAASARAIAHLLGSEVPASIAELVRASASAPFTDDAWQLKDAVAQAARQVYGPPAYVRLAMPGWHA